MKKRKKKNDRPKNPLYRSHGAKKNRRNLELNDFIERGDFSKTELEHIWNMALGRFLNDWVLEYTLRLRREATMFEKQCLCLIKQKDIKFVFQAPFKINGNVYFADFFFPEYNTILEIDGEYHYEENQIKKDKKRDSDFEKCNIKVIRITNKDVHKRTYLEKVLSDIMNLQKRNKDEIISARQSNIDSVKTFKECEIKQRELQFYDELSKLMSVLERYNIRFEKKIVIGGKERQFVKVPKEARRKSEIA